MHPVEQFKVESTSTPGRFYVVSRMDDQTWQCGCLGWTRHVPRRDCQHIEWVKAFGGMEIDPLLHAIGKAQRKAAARGKGRS